MADITRLPTRGQRPEPPRAELTSGMRGLIVGIQDLCIDVSLSSPTHIAQYNYSGHTHELTVWLIPRAHLSREEGGNGSFRAEWSGHAYLPGSGSLENLRQNAWDDLGEILDRLLVCLPEMPTPGGAA